MTKIETHVVAHLAAIVALATGCTATSALAADGVSATSDGLQFESGPVEVTLGGRLHADLASWDNGTVSDSATDLRRARAELAVNVKDIWRLRVDREFAGDGKGWRNAWFSIRATDSVELKFGNQTVPFSLEELQSSNRSPLVERSLVNALAPGFGLGASLAINQPRWTLTAGYFDDALADEAGRSKERGRGAVARLSLKPLSSRRQFLHLGIAGEQREIKASEVVRFSADAGSALAPRLIASGNLRGLERLQALGAEAAWSLGPLLLQAQHARLQLRPAVGSEEHFSADYLQAGWILTGQRYGYSERTGIPTGPDLGRRGGAIELVARYSRVDLLSGLSTAGTGKTLTMGATWYVNENLRLMANYVDSSTDDALGIRDFSGKLWVARLQVSF